MKTNISEMLSIPYPVLQGGMAWIAGASLASAVSHGGGLCVIAAANAPVNGVREQIKKVNAHRLVCGAIQ